MHRDLKLSNVALDSEFNVKVIDFGTAKKVTEEVSHRKSFVGTVVYMSPEVLTRKGETLESDLWALGIMAFQMVTGTLPFTGTKSAIYTRMRLNHINWPRQLDPDCRNFIESLLRLCPADRLSFPELFEHPFLAELDTRSNIKLLVAPGCTTSSISCLSTLECSSSGSDNSKPILTGYLQKTSRFYLRQRRYFELFSDGSLHYYKNRGEAELKVVEIKPGQRCLKVGKASF